MYQMRMPHAYVQVRVHEAIREAGSVHEWNLPSKQAAATAAFTNNRHLRHSHYVYHQVWPTSTSQPTLSCPTLCSAVYSVPCILYRMPRTHPMPGLAPP